MRHTVASGPEAAHGVRGASDGSAAAVAATSATRTSPPIAAHGPPPVSPREAPAAAPASPLGTGDQHDQQQHDQLPHRGGSASITVPAGFAAAVGDAPSTSPRTGANGSEAGAVEVLREAEVVGTRPNTVAAAIPEAEDSPGEPSTSREAAAAAVQGGPECAVGDGQQGDGKAMWVVQDGEQYLLQGGRKVGRTGRSHGRGGFK